MRVVIDTNVVISGIFWSGAPHEILRLWLRGDLTLLVSMPILSEYRTTLQEMIGNQDIETFAKWNRLFMELSEIVQGQTLGRICRDADDDKFLETAVGGKADVLISGDLDLLTLKEIHGIPIQSPRTFLRR